MVANAFSSLPGESWRGLGGLRLTGNNWICEPERHLEEGIILLSPLKIGGAKPRLTKALFPPLIGREAILKFFDTGQSAKPSHSPIPTTTQVAGKPLLLRTTSTKTPPSLPPLRILLLSFVFFCAYATALIWPCLSFIFSLKRLPIIFRGLRSLFRGSACKVRRWQHPANFIACQHFLPSVASIDLQLTQRDWTSIIRGTDLGDSGFSTICSR